jgi:ribosome biogenesis GTPase
MTGLVTKSTGSWYRLKSEEGLFLDARLRGKFKIDNKKITNPIAVGDIVKFEEIQKGEYVISEILDRHNYVIRTSPRKKNHFHLLASNIDQAFLITSYKNPRTSLGFIDRFFITLEAFRIPGYLIINKSDIYSESELSTLSGIKKTYERIGYSTMITSFLDHDPDLFLPMLKGKKTLLAGHSGTGKSTLINMLLPDINQEIGEVSSFANKGIHTTTFAELFFIDDTTQIIDTPGIKELGLAEILPEELSHYFPEMRNYLGDCKYNNCMHINEPGCRIHQALEEGDIAVSRFESYLSMIEGEDNRR